MLYWYVVTYARTAPDLTLATINLLVKDSASADPAVRGVALRTLCALRVPGLVEYATGPVTAGLGDPHPCVRRAAALGALKLSSVDPAAADAAGWMARLTDMLATEPDAGVVANALAALRGARALPPASRSLVIPLLNRIRDFSEWGQCLVMDVACGFAPRDEEEVFALMNALDDRVSSSCAAVALAAARLLLHLTLRMPATHQALLERVKEPLLTLAAADPPERAAVALAHIRVLAERSPALFADAAPLLYPLPSDPAYVADAKLAVLVAVADESTVHDIADELTALAWAHAPARARAAVAALGGVAAAVPGADGVADRLLALLDAGDPRPAVQAEALVQAAALVRRAPDAGPAVAHAVAGLRPADVADAAGRAALVGLLGGAASSLPDAPYALEPLATRFVDEPRGVRLALLRAAAALFAARPAEAAPLLRLCLAAGAADADADVRDRARAYMRLLRDAPDAAPGVLAASPPPPGPATDAATADALFSEFDSLAVLYRAPAATFVDAAAAAARGDASVGVAAAAGALAADADLLALDDGDGEDGVDEAARLLAEFDVGGRPASAASAGGGAGPASPDPFAALAGSSPALAPTLSVDPMADLMGGGAPVASPRPAASAADPFGLGDLLGPQ